jgi:hypothetical protein
MVPQAGPDVIRADEQTPDAVVALSREHEVGFLPPPSD